MSETPSGRATLVLERPFAARETPDCFHRLCDSERPAAVLAVCYRGTAANCLAALRDRGDRIASAAVVHVGPVDDGSDIVSSEAVRVVPDPADLTGVGMAVSDWVEARDGGRPAGVCLDSLSTLLQYADSERAFRFLHALTGQFRTAGVDCHVHFDPAAHDERTVAQFRQLFDDVRDERRDDATPDAVGAGEGSTSVATDGGTPE